MEVRKGKFVTVQRENHGDRLDQAKGRIRRYYLWYTGLFLLLMAGIFISFLLTGRSLIWTPDGRSQYYSQMVYLRRYIRELFAGLMHGDWNVRLYDFTIGMGEGIIVTARVNRLDILSAFVPVRMIGLFYSFVTMFRLYLAGIAFSAYFRYRKMDDRAILVGVIVYLSSGFAICRVTMYPVFGTALYMLPLLFLGVEKILQEGRGVWMMAASAVAFLATYYFAYMCTIAVGGYFLLRWPQARTLVPSSNSRVAAFFKKGFHTVGAWMVGAAMQALILIPTFTHLFMSNRVRVEETGSVFRLYPVKYMVSLLFGFISPDIKPGYSTVLSYIALVIPALVILFFDHFPKKNSLRAAFLIEAAGLLIPFVGLVMGAFGNVSNRWTFILAFTLAYVCVEVIQRGPGYGKRSARVLLVVTVLYSAGALAMLLAGGRFGISLLYRLYVVVGGVCLLASSGVILVMRRRQSSYVSFSRAVTVTACLSAVLMGVTTFQPGLGGEALDYIAWEELPDYYEDMPHRRLHALKDGPFSRADTGYDRRLWVNNALYHDYYGVDEFNSIMDGNLQNFLLELENPGIESAVKNLSMGGGAVCENLASVGYYLTGHKNRIIPYGFEAMPKQEDEKNTLYENRIPLSFAYTYDRAISSDEYEKLSAAQKQQALMKAVVLDEEDLQTLPDGALEQEQPKAEEICVPLLAKEASTEGSVKAEEDGYVLGPEGELAFPIRQKKGCECYLHLIDVSYEDAYASEDDQSITVISGAGTRRMFLRSPEDPYYIPVRGWMAYMGYADQDKPDEIRIRMNGKGRCRINSLEMVYIPMDSFEEDIAKRNLGGCSEPKMLTNTVEGDLDDGGGRFVVLSMLYYGGWKAEVDGEPVHLVKANRCYTGFYVPEGAHHFKLTYTPPYLNIAILLTIAGWAVFIVVLLRTILHNRAARSEMGESGR